VTVSVQQTQPWQIFWMPIDVTIQAPSGDSTFVAHDSLAAQVFTFHMPTEPTQVLLDKDEWILRSSSTSVAVESGPLPHTLELAPPLPNPSRGPATIALSLPHAGNVRVEIVDLAGRRVARLHDGPLAAGVQRFTWDGRVSNGGVASAGVYWVSVEQDGERRARPLVRMR
jgi:hypothetical protein